jgi:transposase
VSGLDLTLDPERQLRRFEVINGAGGRRHWSVDDKARIIAETLEPNATFPRSPVGMALGRSRSSPGAAKRANRSLRCGKILLPFVPAVVTAPEPVAKRPAKQRKRQATRDAGMIELEIDGIAMRVGRGADTKTVAAVIRALKATS